MSPVFSSHSWETTLPHTVTAFPWKFFTLFDAMRGESACGNRVLLYKVEEGGTQKAITPDFIDTSPYIAVLGG